MADNPDTHGTPNDGLQDRTAAVVGAANVLVSGEDLAPFVTDWRDRYHGRARLVARPGNAAGLAEVVRLCYARDVPVVPQGGNTGLCGAATPDVSGRAVVVRLGRMNRVRDANAIVDEVTIERGGTISAEHGIGQSNKQRLIDGRGGADVALMRRIKVVLDPKMLVNPGKVFDPALSAALTGND